jgi:hypothetical protein
MTTIGLSSGGYLPDQRVSAGHHVHEESRAWHDKRLTGPLFVKSSTAVNQCKSRTRNKAVIGENWQVQISAGQYFHHFSIINPSNVHFTGQLFQ